MEDPEISAMNAIAGAMATLENPDLDAAARERVLTWMISRFGPFPSTTPQARPAPEAPAEPGEELTIMLERAGRKPGQASGRLPDGTLVVVDDAEHMIGEEVRIVVKTVRPTNRGQMIFASLADEGQPAINRADRRW